MSTPIPAKITDHATRAVARLPGYQQDAPNWLKLIDALVSEVQAAEDTLDDLMNLRHLSVAAGVQLDVIGEILNEARKSRGDSEYRFVLQGKAAALSGSGEPDRVIDAYLLITQGGSVLYGELQPATIEMASLLAGPDTFTAVDDAAIIASMLKVRAAGVQLILYVVPDTLTEGYAFLWGSEADADGSGDLPIDADHGWGDEADADANGDITPGAGQGGNLARLLQ